MNSIKPVLSPGRLPTATLNRPLKICLAMLLSCLPFLSPCAAQESSSKAAGLRVGVSPVFPPMVFKQGKELCGVEVDLARALGENLGRKVTFVELPWEEQIEALNAGRIDIIMSSMSITMARRQVMNFSHPYLVIGQMTLVRREDQNKYLLGFPVKPPGTVGVLKATTGEFLVQREFPKAERKVFTSEAQAVQALKKKKIDLFISDSPLVWYLAGMHSTEGLAAVPITLSEEQLAWGIRRSDEKLLASADEFIQKSVQDGTLTRILRRWMAVAP
jgi:polar amino acid transport system substrate-binding protein